MFQNGFYNRSVTVGCGNRRGGYQNCLLIGDERLHLLENSRVVRILWLVEYLRDGHGTRQPENLRFEMDVDWTLRLYDRRHLLFLAASKRYQQRCG